MSVIEFLLRHFDWDFLFLAVQKFKGYPFAGRGHGEWHDVRSAVSNHGGGMKFRSLEVQKFKGYPFAIRAE